MRSFRARLVYALMFALVLPIVDRGLSGNWWWLEHPVALGVFAIGYIGFSYGWDWAVMALKRRRARRSGRPKAALPRPGEVP